MAERSPGVLDHVNVLDMSWVAAGPLCGVLFAYYGATVVRLESAVRIDLARNSPPLTGRGINKSAYYASMNLGKYDLCLDLNNDGSRAVTERLIDWADIVIEGFTPGTMAGWDLDYDSLCKRKAGIIMISLTLQGQTGPHASMRGYGLQVHGLSGMASLIGWPDSWPAGVTLAYPDYIVPLVTTYAAIAALDYRDRTGDGQHIDLAQMEATINFTGTAVSDYAVNNRLQQRAGNRAMAGDLPFAAPHGVYPTAGDDRWIAISAFDDDEWSAVCDVLDQREWKADARFATLDARCRNDDALDVLVAAETAKYDARLLMERLQKAGVPAGIVHDQQGVVEDPQLGHRGHFVPTPHGEFGDALPGELFGARLSETPPVIQRSAPLIAEHNEFVLRELLGFTQEEFNDLVASGALEFYGGE